MAIFITLQDTVCSRVSSGITGTDWMLMREGFLARSRRAALAGMGLLLTQLASAGQPAIVHFVDDETGTATKLCMLWDPVATDVSGKQAILTGHLYHKKDGVCRRAFRKDAQDPVTNGTGARSFVAADAVPVLHRSRSGTGQGPVSGSARLAPELPLDTLANQRVRIQYRFKGDYSGKNNLPEHVQTDQSGGFHLRLPAPSASNGVTVTAAWYGQNDESAEPVLHASKQLMTHVEVDVLNEKKRVINPDLVPAAADGIYTLRTRLVSWNGKPVPSSSLLQKVEEVERVGQVLRKEIDIQGLSVRGQDAEPGIAEVMAMIGQFRSEPVLLPFGVHATLERVDKHKDEEIILQRPYGYNDDERENGRFFMDEHAQLQLTLTSLLSGRPLTDIPVTWGVESNSARKHRIRAFLSEKVTEPEVEAKPTDSNGMAFMPVSARHDRRDYTNPANPNAPYRAKAYETAVGKASVQVEFNGQAEQIEIPFIDSLWLIAHPAQGAYGIPQKWAANSIRRVDMVVDGYVGLNGKQARRKFVPFRIDDHSVVPESEARLSSGPVYVSFVDINSGGKAIFRPSNSAGEAGNKRPGLAYRQNINGTGLLTGYFKPTTTEVEEETACLKLKQEWPGGGEKVWWGQAGVTLKVENRSLLCTRVVPSDV